MLRRAVLCYVVLSCAASCCPVLRRAVLYCIVLSCAVVLWCKFTYNELSCPLLVSVTFAFNAAHIGEVSLVVNRVRAKLGIRNWDNNALAVLCRMAGVEGPHDLPAQTLGSEFSQVEHFLWINNVKCLGNESSLLDCKNPGLRNKNSFGLTSSFTAMAACGRPNSKGIFMFSIFSSFFFFCILLDIAPLVSSCLFSCCCCCWYFCCCFYCLLWLLLLLLLLLLLK